MCLCAAAPTPVRNPLIIAQNGASGDYPGSTLSAYVAAVKGGSDYIECSVQITKDGVPICRDGANLVNTTNVALNPDLFETKFTTYQEMGSGVFSFDLTLEEIRTLRGILFSCQFCVTLMIPKLPFGLRIQLIIRNICVATFGTSSLLQSLSFQLSL